MSNELKELVKRIQFDTDKTLHEIAEEIGYSRAYFTNQVNKGTNEELKALLLEKFNLENEQIVSPEIERFDLKKATKEDLLIMIIGEKETRIQTAEGWASKFFDLIKSNLTGLTTHQALLSAQVMTILEREIDKEAKGNLTLKKKLMAKVYKQIDENYAGPSEEDN